MSEFQASSSKIREIADKAMKGEALLNYVQKVQRSTKLIKTKPKAKRTDSKNEDKVSNSEEPKAESRGGSKKGEPCCKERGDTSSTKTELNHEQEDDVIIKNIEDFEQFDEVTTTMLKGLELCEDKIYLTKTEKKCLEDIVKLTTKVRAPLDERQMIFYNKDCDKFSMPIDLKESDNQSDLQLIEAAKAVQETPSKILAAEPHTMASYLTDLKNLIVKREMAWASSIENDYAQKAEIKRLKTEVDNLRVINTKRNGDMREKEQIIANKDLEIMKWQKIVQKMKSRVLALEKEVGKEDEMDEAGSRGRVTTKADSSSERKTKLQQMEDALLAEARNRRGAVKNQQGTGSEVRKNQGPAAILANALYNARNEGNFVHF